MIKAVSHLLSCIASRKMRMEIVMTPAIINHIGMQYNGRSKCIVKRCQREAMMLDSPA
jgi:hypothetical protein